MIRIASTRRMRSPCCADWKACAVPENAVVMLEGSVSAARRFTSLTAGPMETPGARLNDSVTEGICPEWFTVAGPVVGDTLASDPKGTRSPEAEWTYSSPSASRFFWYWGSSSITTQYWLFGV